MSTPTAHRTGSDDTAEPIQTDRAHRFPIRLPRRDRTARPTRTAPAEPGPATASAEPVRSVARLEPHAEPTAAAANPAAAAPDASKRGVAYWLEEAVGVLPLAAPLLLEASLHVRIAEHFLHLGRLSWLLPASLGLGAVTVAFRFDRARLRQDPTALIRAALYGYVTCGFALSYWFLTTVPAKGAIKVEPFAEVPSVVIGLAGAAGVLLWELRTRQRHREVLRAGRGIDEYAVRRAWSFPIWNRRMRRFAVATGQDMQAVARMFAPLIAADLAGKPHAKYPEVSAAPVLSAPAEPRQTAPVRRTEPRQRAAAPAPAPASAMSGPHRIGDEVLLGQLLELYPAAGPDAKPMPSRREIETAVGIGSTVAGRLLKSLAAARAEQTAQQPAAASQ